MAEMDPQPPQTDETFSRNEMETVLRNASLWDREEYCRKNPLMRTVSLQIPYSVAEVVIWCHNLNEYAFHMDSYQGERLSLRFDNETMQKYKDKESDVPREKIPLLGSDKYDTFDKLVEIYVGQASGQLKKIDLIGLPPRWNIDKVLSVKKLEILCGSENESIGYEGLYKFLNQIGSVVETRVLVEAIHGSVLDHKFFKTHSFQCWISEYNVAMLLKITSSDCRVSVSWTHYVPENLAKCLAHYAEEMVKLHPIGFTIVFKIPEDLERAHEAIEWILTNKEGWVFKTYDKSFAVTFVWREKEVVLSYEAPNSLYRLEVYPAWRLQPYVGIDRDQLIPLNRELMVLPYKTRKEMECRFPWESCLPYEIQKLKIDFVKLELEIDEKNRRFTGKDGFYKFLSELFCHYNTSVTSLVVEGTDDNSESMVRQISAKRITLTYMGVHSNYFFEWFNWSPSVPLENITTTTFQSIQHGWHLIQEAETVFIANNRGSILLPQFTIPSS